MMSSKLTSSIVFIITAYIIITVNSLQEIADYTLTFKEIKM